MPAILITREKQGGADPPAFIVCSFLRGDGPAVKTRCQLCNFEVWEDGRDYGDAVRLCPTCATPAMWVEPGEA